MAVRSNKSVPFSSHGLIWVRQRMTLFLLRSQNIDGDLHSFTSGAYISLLSNPVMELGPTEDLGRRLGMFMSIFALGALGGPPISGAIRTVGGGFKAVGYYAGISVLLSPMECIVELTLYHRDDDHDSGCVDVDN